MVWYMSLYRIGMLPGYVQSYSSSSKFIGKAHDVGLVSKVPTMDQTHKMADSHTLSMHIVAFLSAGRTVETYLGLILETKVMLLIQS